MFSIRIVACLPRKRFECTRSVLFGGFFILMLAGCITPGLSLDSGMRESAARDFAVSLASLTNSSTALSMRAPERSRGFAAAFQQALREEGFNVANEPAANALVVSYRIESVSNQNSASERYTVNVGPMVISREYQRDNENSYPVSNFEVENTAQPVVVATALPQQLKADPFVEMATSSAASARVTQVTAVPEPAEIPPGLPNDISSIERKNMYETRVSAFSEFTKGYESIEKKVLVFPNDSLRITRDVRSSLDTLSRMYRAESDVFSVIGCSHGNTNLANGNALLAIGRSKRVKQFLVEQGVPVHRILDEGCWAPVHFDEAMPRRGVVIELKRS